MIKKKVLAFLVFFLVPSFALQAYWVWSPEEGKFVNPEETIQDAAGEQYDYAMSLYRDGSLDKAINELRNLLKQHRNARIAPQAQYDLGVLYEEKGDYLRAFDAYKTLIQSYPQNEHSEEVIERQFRIGNLFLSGRKGRLLGLEILPSLPRAVEVFEHIVEYAPYSAYGDQAQFRLGIALKESGRYDDAIEAFQRVVDNYPQSELVPDARFQMTEAAFLRSGASGRDQRALENAAAYADRFLARHPDTTGSEKAARIRQKIDEKNAEKNYRVAAYYEKTDYLSSALIYYRDVAERYPHTSWGQKAAEKVKSLEEPVSYVSGHSERLEEEIGRLRAAIPSLEKGDERKALEQRLDRLKEDKKQIARSTEEGVLAREQDLRRREREWREKWKNFEDRQKMLEAKPSEALERALERWEASLLEEKGELDSERLQLRAWKEALGIKPRGFWRFVPFIGRGDRRGPDELEEVYQIDARRLDRVVDERRGLLEEKERLYKQYHEALVLLAEYEQGVETLQARRDDLLQTAETARWSLAEKEKAVESQSREIESLERKLQRKQRLFNQEFGEPVWGTVLSLPVKAVTASAGAVGKSFEVLNPFSSKGADWNELSLEELFERRSSLREKITAEEEVTKSLSEAFDEAVAWKEEQRILAAFEDEGSVDVHEMRRTIKRIEKEIRAAYEEIDDRYDRIRLLSGELEEILEARQAEGSVMARTGRTLTAPVRAVAGGTRSFLFGRKPREAAVLEASQGITGDDPLARRIQRLREEIELEGLLVESRNREIFQLQRQLDVAQAKASAAGGYRFRSSMVTVPHEFMEDAITTARSIIPKEKREEVIFDRLHESSKKKDVYQQELERVESEIASREERGEAKPGPAVIEGEKAALPEEERMAEEIRLLSQRLDYARSEYERSREALEKERMALMREVGEKDAVARWEKETKGIEGKKASLYRDVRTLHEELTGLIRKEENLESAEADILEKRIHKIDELVRDAHSRPIAQVLLSEREKLESRLNQIEARRHLLSKELDRFQPANPKVF